MRRDREKSPIRFDPHEQDKFGNPHRHRSRHTGRRTKFAMHMPQVDFVDFVNIGTFGVASNHSHRTSRTHCCL
jgi:hypothetical protein